MLHGGIPRINEMALVAKIHHNLLLYILLVRDVVILCKFQFLPRLILYSVSYQLPYLFVVGIFWEIYCPPSQPSP